MGAGFGWRWADTHGFDSWSEPWMLTAGLPSFQQLEVFGQCVRGWILHTTASEPFVCLGFYAASLYLHSFSSQANIYIH